MPDPSRTARARPALPAEFTVVTLLCAYAVLRWLRNFGFSPDSTSYVTAATNFLRTGHLFVYANWPSHSMAPAVEPYTEYAPGLPLLLAPFVLVLRSPVLAAAVAQGVAIVLFYAAVHGVTFLLGFRAPVRLGTLALFTALRTFAFIQGWFWTETLFIALSVGVGACAIRALHDRAPRRWWLLGAALMALSSLVRYTGVANVAWFLPVAVQACAGTRTAKATANRAVRAALVIGGLVVAACAPVLAWLVRNELVYGYESRSHHVFAMFRGTTLLPFHWAMSDLFSVRAGHPLLVLLPLAALVALPLLRRTDGRSLHALLVCAAAAHFAVVWLPSLVAFFDPLDDRLLSPAIALGCLAAMSGLSTLERALPWRAARAAAWAVPFAFLALSAHVDVAGNSVGLPGPQAPLGTVRWPREMRLWRELHQLDWMRSCSHFYTNHDFNHQMFAGIPQRVVWKPVTLDPPTVTQLLSTGTSPFLLLSNESGERSLVEREQAAGRLRLQRVEFADPGFTVYRNP